MNKKIALSAMSILTSLALLGGATFAFFSDAGKSSDNVFKSGTLDMLLSDSTGPEVDKDSVSGTWGLASAPGDPFSGTLDIKNSGSVDADHIELVFSNLVTNALSGPGTVSSIPMDTVIEITELKFDTNADGDYLDAGEDLLASVVAGGNGIKDLNDLESTVFDDIDFSGVQSTNHTLSMKGRLHPDQTVDQHQGDSVNMTLDVTMNQNASQ